MKKIAFALSALLLAALPLRAQTLTHDGLSHISMHYETPALRYDDLPLAGNKYVSFSLSGYELGGELGHPALPVKTTLLALPVCDSAWVTVENAVYDTLTPIAPMSFLPMQSSRCKTPGKGYSHVLRDSAVYATDGQVGMPTASIVRLGTGRDVDYATLLYSPVSVNPVTGQVVVCREADITIRFVNVDEKLTVDRYQHYHNGAFSLGTTANRLVPDKYVPTEGPLSMVVVVPNFLRCRAVDQFVEWKTNQGIKVTTVYFNDEGLSSADQIANRLKDLYTNATADAPAPTYVVLMGDDNVMPSFKCSLPSNNRMHSYYFDLDDHNTDLYYVTWAGDDLLPEAFLGRLSARDSVSLGHVISKILLYEQYNFADDSYLANAALVAGVDQTYYMDTNDNGYNYADPSMDYIAANYVNSANGYNEVRYYKNRSTYAPAGVTVSGSSNANSASSTLLTYYNNGVGWINYSAHGDWDRWYRPSFKVSDANSMTNRGKPAFMIGNCCLTNQFDKNTCFGEALLRATNNTGAAAYIGATNSTFWGEDFYWSVGYRSSISPRMSTAYDAAHPGVYDLLYHTHGETYDKHIVTAGDIVTHGNMTVNSLSSSSSWGRDVAAYYWEIYLLMGDPSMLPWCGVASDLTASVTINYDINVATEPHVYVALVDHANGNVLDAAYTDASGRTSFHLPDGVRQADCHVAITAQGYKPYRFDLSNLDITSVANGQVSVYPNPAAAACTISASGLRSVEMIRVNGQSVMLQKASSDCAMLSLGNVAPGLYILRIATDHGVVVRKLVVR